MSDTIEWFCPRCHAGPDEHGKGLCASVARRGGESCQGFLCECDGETTKEHGTTYADACPEATCHHCGWGGTFPKKPKGLQAWERKALDAGWAMPAARRREVGL